MDPVWTFSKNLPLICSAPHEACTWKGKKKKMPAYLATMPRAGFNLLNPTGYVMLKQFNIQQLYALPTLYLCLLYSSQNKQRLVHNLIGFYNRDEKCLQRGTDWVFK